MRPDAKVRNTDKWHEPDREPPVNPASLRAAWRRSIGWLVAAAAVCGIGLTTTGAQPPWLTASICPLTFVLGLIGLTSLLQTARRAERKHINDRFCPGCEYDMKGLVLPEVCPECGCQFRQRGYVINPPVDASRPEGEGPGDRPAPPDS